MCDCGKIRLEIKAMDILLAIVLLAMLIVVLDQSSHMTVDYASKVADITGLGKTTIGFLLLAFSTSVPELCVAFIASLSGEAALSAGNVIGSNIANIGLVIGIAVLLVALRRPKAFTRVPSFAKEELSSLYFGLFVASIVPLSLIYLVEANWLVGLVLITIFVVYTYQLLKIRIPAEAAQRITGEMRKKLHPFVALTFLGIIGVIISSYFIVEFAVDIAVSLNVPRTLIGATIIAFGTSLPEFSTTVKAFLGGQTALAFGNIVGSCFINITLILGITLLAPALIGNALIMNMLVFLDLVIFSLIANLFFWYFLSLGRMGWKEGAILVFIYLLFLATTLSAVQIRLPSTP
jgi:cation:H+ antiporter